jgi:hypothetical protein
VAVADKDEVSGHGVGARLAAGHLLIRTARMFSTPMLKRA